ncbi:MAG: acyl-CoA thioesterase [Saprospirales bacterium]|nr:MAG: acyl-CoA thioesterase [Saprospirales bacterium]
MFTHETRKRVRYGETDRMGLLYYGNYAQYYEIGRVEMIRSLGLTYKDIEDKLGVLMPVVTLYSRFIKPAYYDEDLRIKTTISEFPVRTIVFHTEILRANGELINKGEVKLVFVTAENFKRVDTPVEIRNKLKPWFEKVD